MRAKHTALILTAGFLLLPTLSWSQFPGMGGGGEGRPSMRGNPDMLFNMFARGGDVIYVDQLDPQTRAGFDKFGPMLGLSGNQITREQFSNAMSRVREMAAQGGMGGMNFRMGGGGGGGMPMTFTMPGGGGGGMPGMPGEGFGGNDRGVEEYFNRLDVNEDGVLDHHELTGDRVAEALAAEFDKYDLDHNNMIDLNEFKAYMKARRGDRNPNGPDAAADEETKKRPTVIRAGNLPRDFPYAMLDTDGDGQIGLYEWKAAGKRIGDFLAMDLNNDGFLTVDEYYRWKKDTDEKNGVSGSQFARGRGGMPGMPGGNMMAMNMNGMPGGMNFDRNMMPGGFGPGGGDRQRGPGGFGPGGGDRQRGPGGFGPGGGDRQRGPGGFGPGGELGMAMPGRFGDQGGGQRNFGQFPGMGGDQGGGYNRFPGGGGNFGGGGGAMPGFNPGAFNPGNGGGAFTPPGGGDRRGPGGDSAGDRSMRKSGFNNNGGGSQGNGDSGGRPTRKGGFGGGGGGGGPGRTR